MKTKIIVKMFCLIIIVSFASSVNAEIVFTQPLNEEASSAAQVQDHIPATLLSDLSQDFVSSLAGLVTGDIPTSVAPPSISIVDITPNVRAGRDADSIQWVAHKQTEQNFDGYAELNVNDAKLIAEAGFNKVRMPSGIDLRFFKAMEQRGKAYDRLSKRVVTDKQILWRVCYAQYVDGVQLSGKYGKLCMHIYPDRNIWTVMSTLALVGSANSNYIMLTEKEALYDVVTRLLKESDRIFVKNVALEYSVNPVLGELELVYTMSYMDDMKGHWISVPATK